MVLKNKLSMNVELKYNLCIYLMLEPRKGKEMRIKIMEMAPRKKLPSGTYKPLSF